MRILIGIVAGTLWCYCLAWLTVKSNMIISVDAQCLSTAIIIAGAMAGGE